MFRAGERREHRRIRHICLAVSDSGTGMDQAMPQRVTEPFFTTKPNGKGTGPGLVMVRNVVVLNVVEDLDGCLVLRRRPGEGTAADMWLPRAGRPNKRTRPREQGSRRVNRRSPSPEGPHPRS